jgi:ADP-dependent NAD(P)H-hydrate dehydratase / NAD(P)H-hydrate epimerase
MSTKRWIWVFAGISVAGVVAVGATLLAFLPTWVEGQVVDTAHAYGIEIEPGEIGFGFDWVQIDNAKIRLAGVRSLELRARRIDVSLHDFLPESIVLDDVEVSGQGPLATVLLELGNFSRTHAAALAIPLSASRARVHLSEKSGAAPWLEVSAALLLRHARGGIFSAPATALFGLSLGRVFGSFSKDSALARFAFGEPDVARGPLEVELEGGAKKSTARLTLAPVAIQKLPGFSARDALFPGATASGSASLELPAAELVASREGHAHITLKGYIPPHPLELDGFVFGDTTSFDTGFTLPDGQTRMLLHDSVVTAGRFQIKGGGILSFATDPTELSLDLRGDLPCDALAGAAAESRLAKILGSALSAKAGALARRSVQGSVSVTVAVAANSKNWAAAKVNRRIGIGCGLRPLPLAELAKLFPLPPELADLSGALSTLPQDLSGLPPLPAGLPALPSGLPPLPTRLPTQLPNFPGSPPISLPTGAGTSGVTQSGSSSATTTGAAGTKSGGPASSKATGAGGKGS